MNRTAIASVGLALVAATAPAAAQEPLTDVQVVQLVQSSLAALGEDPGPIDGVMGPQTRAAISAFAQSSDIEIAWAGRSIDPDQAMAFNAAAADALAQAFGHAIDGRYGYIDAYPGTTTDALVAGTLEGVAGGVDCTAAPDAVVAVNGLIVVERDRAPVVVTAEPPVMNPLPRTGEWHPEAEPWVLRIVSADVIAFAQEGDNYVYGRCQ